MANNFFRGEVVVALSTSAVSRFYADGDYEVVRRSAADILQPVHGI